MIVIISTETKDQIKIAFDNDSEVNKWLDVLTNNLKTDDHLMKEQKMQEAAKSSVDNSIRKQQIDEKRFDSAMREASPSISALKKTMSVKKENIKFINNNLTEAELQ